MLVSKTKHPPTGWNSYDSYGVFLSENHAIANLDSFVERLKPFGYEYFVIDAGWYFDHKFSRRYPAEKGAWLPHTDEYGRLVPSPVNFPNGLKFLADACHERGVKFGVHIMRGIPRAACDGNLPIKNSKFHANDIADKNAICTWGTFMYGVDHGKPGAQEYYDSVVEYLAENGVDFIKADDIVEFPDEIQLLAQAIDKVCRPILLSLSPGNETFRGNWDTFKRYGNMVRITRDIWDLPAHANVVFDRWEQWEDLGGDECWLDLDMIPFGGIQVHVPKDTPEDVVPVLGCRRQSWLNDAQKRTFITQRALAASPLFFGGDLPMSREEDMRMVTHPEILACNRNGVIGKKIFNQRHIDIRRAAEKNRRHHGWIGIFNRQPVDRDICVTASEMGFDNGLPATLRDVWGKAEIRPVDNELHCHLVVDDVLFIRYND